MIRQWNAVNSVHNYRMLTLRVNDPQIRRDSGWFIQMGNDGSSVCKQGTFDAQEKDGSLAADTAPLIGRLKIGLPV